MRTSNPSSSTASTIASAARTARSGSSSCATGTPNAAITASPANFSTVPPCASMQCAIWSKKPPAASARSRDRRWRRAPSSRRGRRRAPWRACAPSPKSTRRRLPGAGVPYDGPVLDPKVFKAYDVRGLYGRELDEEGAYAIGRAYVEHFEPRTIAVGRDMRVSAPSMAAAVMDGAADGGADVLRPRHGRHGDGLLRRRRARPRGRHLRHRLPQPEAVHGDEDRPRAARCRSAATRASTTSGCAPRPVSAR